MAIMITCPRCDKQQKVADDVLGKKIRCKGCEKLFVAALDEDEEDEEAEEVRPKRKAKPPVKKPVPAKPPAAKKEPAKSGKSDIDDEDAKAYGVTHEDLGPRCPNCANAMESETAIVCLYCGFNTRRRIRIETKKVAETTGGDIFLWLLPGIACALGVIGILTFDILFCIMIEDVPNDEWYAFMKTLGVKIWLVVPSLFVMFGLGQFAVKRLIFNYMPPEIEEKFEKEE